MASILVNGFLEGVSISRLTVDEALMNHFGTIVIAARLSEAKEVVLVGDINQLPCIDMENLFEMRYCKPNLTTGIYNVSFLARIRILRTLCSPPATSITTFTLLIPPLSVYGEVHWR
ncbi:unnamed protein product [Euphydryas editha]|uniref:(+)RNA virus helicase C-terminal domain-containing protein n=1 Tax=Euphydryas editha TaxID=104508 RepID=A0AAU9UI25_EUPED|nr:unnamed protein product [Euphydryas editha]